MFERADAEGDIEAVLRGLRAGRAAACQVQPAHIRIAPQPAGE